MFERLEKLVSLVAIFEINFSLISAYEKSWKRFWGLR